MNELANVSFTVILFLRRAGCCARCCERNLFVWEGVLYRFKLIPLIVFYRSNIFFKKIFLLVSKRVFKKTISGESAISKNNKIIKRSAEKLGISVRKLSHQYFQLKYNDTICYSNSSDFSFENLMAYKMCGNKFLTSTILSENDLPVPLFNAFSRGEYDKAQKFFLTQNSSMVVKPCNGTAGGKGISVGVSSSSGFAHAFAKALCYSDSVMVEKFASGQNYRFTVLNGRVMTVVKRLPAYVVGDGVNTISTLISSKNDALFDSTMETRLLKPITVDGDVKFFLKDQGLTLKSIPEEGKKVFLRKVSNADQGGEVLEVTGQCHSDYLEMAVQAASLMNTALSGVDLIVEDITAPFEQGKTVINEVNTTPALYIVREPGANGEIDTRVGEEILNYAFDLTS